jgi:FtsH-binding integral membrane protein
MGLFGIVLASLVNLFLRSPAVDWATSIIGVLVFTGLTAYDTQKLKTMAVPAEGGDAEERAAVSGALALYLDFINLFLSLLRLMGRRRE